MLDNSTIRLEIPSLAQHISVARHAIDGIATWLPLTDEQVYDVKLAIGEACSNAVRHGGVGSKFVQVLYHVRPNELEIEVRNTGNAYTGPGRDLTPPKAHLLPEGQMGLYLISQVMDDWDIISASGETVVRMVKRVRE